MGNIFRHKSIAQSKQFASELFILREGRIGLQWFRTRCFESDVENADTCVSLGKGAHYCPP
jgi:hypothetical protein